MCGVCEEGVCSVCCVCRVCDVHAVFVCVCGVCVGGVHACVRVHVCVCV